MNKDIWRNEITSPEKFVLGQPFKFIVHNLTKDNFDDEFATSVISSSLITDKTMGVYNCYNNSKVGFILYPENIIVANYEDCYTNNESRDELFNKKPSMKTPDEIEKYCVDTCKKVNGEILSDQISTIYSEIVIDGFYPIAIYTITNGEKEISWNYRRGLELNKKYGFTFIDIDKSIYRSNHGLEPITNKEKKELCVDLFILLNKKYDEELINKYYKIIFEEFIDLKNKNTYNPEKLLDIGRKLIKVR